MILSWINISQNAGGAGQTQLYISARSANTGPRRVMRLRAVMPDGTTSASFEVAQEAGNVTTLSKPYINPALCNSCGDCAGACPGGSTIIAYNARINSYVINAAACMACMTCQQACPRGAPTLEWSGMTNVACPSCGSSTWEIDNDGNVYCTTCGYKPVDNV